MEKLIGEEMFLPTAASIQALIAKKITFKEAKDFVERFRDQMKTGFDPDYKLFHTGASQFTLLELNTFIQEALGLGTYYNFYVCPGLHEATAAPNLANRMTSILIVANNDNPIFDEERNFLLTETEFVTGFNWGNLEP